MNTQDFQKRKIDNIPITMVTSYDSWSAALIERSSIDTILVGDSLAMVMHGDTTTLLADSQMMAMHVRAVRRGAPNSFIIGDMPFLSYRKGLLPAMETVELLMRSGANAVKLEGVDGHEDIIEHIIRSGVPVMGHLGLTPQSVHQFGGYRVQGKGDEDQSRIIEQAKRLEELGCFSIVLECIPSDLGRRITEELTIPTIGIGAGNQVDGQVLVLQDLLGLSGERPPKFVKQYLDGSSLIIDALNQYDHESKDRTFPTAKESYR